MRKLRHGFTLIEILVVMTLIALLLTLAVPRYFRSVDSGKATVQRQNLATIRDAIDKFSADLGRYPESLDELVARHYLRQVPVDPVSELATWTIVAPADPTQGNVYDVMPASSPASSPAAPPAAPPAASPASSGAAS
ncbi:prepilin-type N-terminal cleavage/methylation domain-containing protein [Ramlibacter sp. G-1-2-2]|uniref:Prepilin-type N-terminal cleavage/methylation domain-containing protein n=1 Tax=Ramlibacter agri TaxID=2728837 RepID=A0A848H7G1_9BURK|nr:prepilin-type N-terminal cleavage/methylation domain-containing protein [Ramlibacter agri]NML44473.1 prepilin-type N-terminal cleavage/methylation domain-containing protein [Ramlibacter agri]